MDNNNQNQQMPYGYQQQIPNGYPQQMPNGYQQQVPNGYPQQMPNGYQQQIPNGYQQQVPYGNPQQMPYGYPQQPQKKGDKKIIIIALLAIIAIIGIAIAIIVINSKDDGGKNDDSQNINTTAVMSNTTEQTTAAPVQSPITSDEQVSYDGLEKKGNSTVGYVYLPVEYVNYSNIEDNQSVAQCEYTSLTTGSIIAITVYDSPLSLEEISINAAQSFESAGVYEDVTVSDVTIGGYPSKQCYAHNPENDLYVVAWFFFTPDKNSYVHYIGVQFYGGDIAAFNYVDQTFTMN